MSPKAGIDQIAGEIEDLGRSTRLALSSRLCRVIIHLMNLQAANWRGTILHA